MHQNYPTLSFSKIDVLNLKDQQKTDLIQKCHECSEVQCRPRSDCYSDICILWIPILITDISFEESVWIFFYIYLTLNDYSFFVKLANCHLYYSQKLACRILFIALSNLHNIFKKSDNSNVCIHIWFNFFSLHIKIISFMYSKTCEKQPLKNRQNKDLNDKW